MEKKYWLKGLTCPNCSMKIERDVGKLDGVHTSSINLVQQVLTVKMAGAETYNLLEKVSSIVHGYEPDVQVEEMAGHKSPARAAASLEQDDKKTLLRLGIGAGLYAAGLVLWHAVQQGSPLAVGLFVAAYGILGWDVLLSALRNIGRGQVFDENFLMSVSTLGAFYIQQYPEAVAVMLFYQIGEFFQNMAVQRSRKSITDLMDVRPDVAVVKRNGAWESVSPESVGVGELIRVNPGEKIPLDGVVADGASMVDTSCLTGESLPQSVQKGDSVWAGTVNQNGSILIEVQKLFEESAASKMIDLVENAASRKAPSENFITTFSRYYTPVVVGAAVILAFVPPLFMGLEFQEWLNRGLVFLVISCPCALVLSIPLTFFGGLGAASRKGILIKGGNYLEALTKVEAVAFDKTGTLTKGVFQVAEVHPEPGFSREDVLRYAAYAEGFSNHPIARSIRKAYQGEIHEEMLEDYQEIASGGVCARIQGKQVLAGSAKFLQDYGIACSHAGTMSGTKVYTALEGKLAGMIVIADEMKEDSPKAVRRLKEMGVKHCVMLTGDNQETAGKIAQQAGIDTYFASLMPQDKVQKIEEMSQNKSRKGKLAFVGDGINDAPVLARSDIGIAMGGLGSDAAAEAADVVLMTDEPSKLAEGIQIARDTKSIVIQNIIFALAVKAVFLLMGAHGDIGLWEAVFADVGVMLLAVLNAMRILKK